MRLMAKGARERKIFDCENDGSALVLWRTSRTCLVTLAVDLNRNLGFTVSIFCLLPLARGEILGKQPSVAR